MDDQLRYAWRVLSVVSIASVLTGLGTSSLNVALPEVSRHFAASATAASWMLLSFMLTTTTLMVFFGRLADLFGRRRMYLCGLATYTAASLALGFAPTAWTVVALRVLQAAGGTMLLANSAALLTTAFPRQHLGRGMGIYIASFSVAQLLGPTLGGFLSHRFGWQWVFWSNVPFGLLCLVWGAAVLRTDKGRTAERGVDAPGNILILFCLGSFLLGLSQVGERGWADPLVFGSFALFVVLAPVFLTVERRRRNPAVDINLFRDPGYSFGLVAGLLNTIARMAVLLLVALFYQAVQGDDPVAAGLKVLLLPLTTVIASTSSGLLHGRMSNRAIAVTGAGLTAVGLVLLAIAVSPTVPYGPIALALVLIGAGSGLFMPANTTEVMNGLPRNRVGIGNAMRLTVQNVGVMVSTALALSIITSPLPGELRDEVFAGTISGVSGQAVDQLVLGYRIALLCMTAIALCGLAASVVKRRAAGQPEPVARLEQRSRR
ncbi:DHA2 family efflux MFS transporter permease subunit [Saccharopolyspora sp. K220]|uniref:DHA2 family efflux MFS transporter permease subunit n=1 Tax=Saccharopolyspora soli TaxID=2926618 RepID=UPI001F55BF54|nr:DHA2 family efflux MFS transporter permease subunit [Saccharopolyspora soli]MCI2418823.1 DHA2 family efflux MFS transporter permease subunit [Saccharopolyspora soli]